MKPLRRLFVYVKKKKTDLKAVTTPTKPEAHSNRKLAARFFLQFLLRRLAIKYTAFVANSTGAGQALR